LKGLNTLIPVLFLLFLFIGAGCGTVKPLDPEEAIDEPLPPEQGISGLRIPIELQLKPYFKDIEKSVPKEFEGNEAVCEGVSYQYFFKRNPIEFSSAGKLLRFAVDGAFWLKLSYCPKCVSLFGSEGNCVTPRIPASCGVDESLRRAEVSFTTGIKLTPSYNLQSTTKLESFDVKDPCEVTVFQYDATKQLKKEVSNALKGLEKEIDKQIASADVKSSIESAWKSLNEPIHMAPYGYLCFQPLAMAVDPIVFEKEQAKLALHLRMKPYFSTSKPTQKEAKLPPLEDFKEENGFQVELDVQASYDSLSSILNQGFSGQTFHFKNKGIVIDSLFIHSALHQKINIKVHFSGSKTGIFYLTATPTYNPKNSTLSLPDADFDLNSKHALLQTAKWMFHDAITNAIREKAVIDVSKYLQDAKKALDKELNTEISKGVFLSGSTDEIDISGIYPQKDQLIIRIRTRGKLSLKLEEASERIRIETFFQCSV
jgi:hypothetical protein